MKKSFSLLSLILVFPLFICGMFFILNFSYTPSFASADTQTVEIGTAEEFVDFVNNYDASSQNTNIVLTSNINLQGQTLTSTIGTSDYAFQGTFNGQGYSISNITFEIQNQSGNLYVGIFGKTSGATIKNLQISGSYNISINESTYSYIGLLVGNADNNTTIDKCLVTATLSSINFLDSNTFKNVFIGGIVGDMQGNSSITNSISRAQLTNGIEFGSNNYSYISAIGAVVGYLDASSLLFTISQASITVAVSDTYSGSVYVGGIAGYIVQSSSRIINAVTETTLNVDTNATVGIVGGYISNNSPEEGNLSSIIYYYTSSYQTFGQNKSGSSYEIYSVSSTIQNYSSVEEYFTDKQNLWNAVVGDKWDFSNIWTTLNSNINLQPFIGDFTFSVQFTSLNIGTSQLGVLDVVYDFESGYRYDNTASFTFKFSTSNEYVKNYYQLSNLNLGNTVVGTFIYNEADDSYSLLTASGYDRISLTKNTSDDTYTVTISGVTDNYDGTYSITISAVQFTGVFTYRLYDDGNIVGEDEKSEAFVYITDSQNTRTREVSISYFTYNYETSVTTQQISTSLYAFTGWYLVVEDGEDIEITTLRTLEITFGEGYFIDDFEVYARYDSDACNLIFSIDDGVQMIILGSEQYYVEETNVTIPIFKQLTQLRMSVYIKENYIFDVNEFMDLLNTYKIDQSATDFCSLVSETVTEDGLTVYEFSLNMTNLDSQFSDVFTITFTTTYDNSDNNTLIWIIVGSIAGALLLAGLIVLIIFLVRRRGSGGGGGKIRTSFKKGMYY